MNTSSLYLDVNQIRASIARDKYVDDPVGWVNNSLGGFTWSKLQDILQSVSNNKRTAVYGCNNFGKSWVAARLIAWWIMTHPLGSAKVVTTASKGRQVKAIIWDELGKAHAKAGLPGRMNQTQWFIKMPDGNESMVAFGHKPDDASPTAISGVHAEYVLVVIDEACDFHPDLWDYIDTLVSNVGSKELVIGNPDNSNSYFADVCKPGSGFNTISVGSDETPNFTGEEVPEVISRSIISEEWAKERLKKWGKDNPLYVSKVLGKWPDISTDGLISMQWIRDAQSRELEPSLPNELGVDVGAGGNKTVVVHRLGAVARTIRSDTNPDTMATLSNIMLDIRTTGASLCKVDVKGIGRGIVDRAKEVADDEREPKDVRDIASKIVGIDVSEKSPEDGFVNLRAFGFWQLRKRYEEGEMDIDAREEDLAAQLAGLKYKPKLGSIQIEEKPKGKDSPDDADGHMFAFLKLPAKRVVDATW